MGPAKAEGELEDMVKPKDWELKLAEKERRRMEKKVDSDVAINLFILLLFHWLATSTASKLTFYCISQWGFWLQVRELTMYPIEAVLD